MRLSCDVDTPINPLPREGMFSQGNMESISATIPINISVNLNVVENIHIGANCSPEEIVIHQRKFQLKMGLLNLIQIPCHHVLANEIALNLNYRIGFKHFFNINLGIGIIKKNYFFCLYFRHIYLCFYSNFNQESSLDADLNSASNEYLLDILLTVLSTPRYLLIITLFQVFLVFGVAGTVKSMPSGYSLDTEFNSASNELSRSKFE